MMYKFETWICETEKHNSLTFNNLQSALKFAADFVEEHKAWGEWLPSTYTGKEFLSLFTSGSEKNEYYNLKIIKQ